MSIHLHHAMTNSIRAIEELSAAQLWSTHGEHLSSLHDTAVRAARDYLARAAGELNAYDAKQSVKAATT